MNCLGASLNFKGTDIVISKFACKIIIIFTLLGRYKSISCISKHEGTSDCNYQPMSPLYDQNEKPQSFVCHSNEG